MLIHLVTINSCMLWWFVSALFILFSQTTLLLGSWISPVAMSHPQTKESQKNTPSNTEGVLYTFNHGCTLRSVSSVFCCCCWIFFFPLPPSPSQLQINLYHINHSAKQIRSMSICFSWSQGISWIVIWWLYINKCSICHFVYMYNEYFNYVATETWTFCICESAHQFNDL